MNYVIRIILILIALACIVAGIWAGSWWPQMPAMRCIAFGVALTATASLIRKKKYSNLLSGVAFLLIVAAFVLLAMGRSF